VTITFSLSSYYAIAHVLTPAVKYVTFTRTPLTSQNSVRTLIVTLTNVYSATLASDLGQPVQYAASTSYDSTYYAPKFLLFNVNCFICEEGVGESYISEIIRVEHANFFGVKIHNNSILIFFKNKRLYR
jgi:hypothetical protein